METDWAFYILWLAVSLLAGFCSGVAAKRLIRRLERRRLLVAGLLVPLFFLLLSAPPARGEELLRIPSLELYAPARVVVSFAYTRNVTIQVSTLGASLYKAVTGPTQIEFQTDSFDVYTLSISIQYEAPVNQTVVIGLFEGGRAAKGLELPMRGNSAQITMKLTVIEAPRFPTAEEVAERVLDRFRNEILRFEAGQRELVGGMTGTVTTMAGLSAIAFAVSVALIVAVFHIHGRVAELSEWGIRHEEEHRRREERR
jgi:hypothetical protein